MNKNMYKNKLVTLLTCIALLSMGPAWAQEQLAHDPRPQRQLELTFAIETNPLVLHM